MMRSKASKDSSRGFQVSSEISFLISVRKILLTSDQTIDLTTKKFLVWKLNGSSIPLAYAVNRKGCSLRKFPDCLTPYQTYVTSSDSHHSLIEALACRRLALQLIGAAEQWSEAPRLINLTLRLARGRQPIGAWERRRQLKKQRIRPLCASESRNVRLVLSLLFSLLHLRFGLRGAAFRRLTVSHTPIIPALLRPKTTKRPNDFHACHLQLPLPGCHGHLHATANSTAFTTTTTTTVAVAFGAGEAWDQCFPYRSVTAGYRRFLPIPLLGGNPYRR